LLLARATQPDIARQVGVNLMTIVKDEVAIRQEWTKERARAYERYLAEDLQRLGALERALWLPAMQGNLGAIDRILDIINQRSRLLGLEAPSRTEVTVLTEETVDAAIRRLEGELGHAEHHRGPVIETLALEAATGSQGPEQHGNGPVAPST
jgi:hypothetical protein